MEGQDGELFRRRFLPGAIAAFSKLRRAVDLTIRDLGNELGCTPMVIPLTQAKYSEYMDLEQRKYSSATLEVSNEHPSTALSEDREDEVSARVAAVSKRLSAEVKNATMPTQRESLVLNSQLQPPSDLQDITEDLRLSRESSRESASKKSINPSHSPAAITSALPEALHEKPLPLGGTECGMQSLRLVFDAFSAAQHQLLQDALVGGELWDSDLLLHQPRATLKETFGTDGIPDDEVLSLPYAHTTVRQRKRSDATGSPVDAEDRTDIPVESENIDEAQNASDVNILMNGHSLIRVWGFLFALE